MNLRSQRGSVLLTTTTFLIIIIVGVWAVFDMALNGYRLSQRNELRARARAVAESELEYLYYNFESQIVGGGSPANVPSALVASGVQIDIGSTPVTYYSPFAQAQQSQSEGWQVQRSIMYNETVTGTVPGTTTLGTISYLTAEVIVTPGASSGTSNPLSVRVGRRLNSSTTSIFQYSIFFQGDLELAPSGITTITGDIAANGSIYMGASSGGTLTINNAVKYLGGGQNYFNQDSAGNATYRKPGTWNAATASIVTDDTTTLSAPLFGTSQSSQVQTLATPENLLGGLDASALATQRNDLFGPTDNSTDTAIAENNVYRSLIAPPPSATTSSTTEYPSTTNLSTTADDPNLNALRAYTRAGLIITVSPAGAISFTEVRNGVATTPPSSTYNGVVTSATMYDQREGSVSGATGNVAITQIDVGALATALSTSFPMGSNGQPTYNGLLYVNLQNAAPGSLAAVRLVNGATTPNVSTGSGFSVATNGGLYVKGSYNTTPYTDSNGVNSNNPAMLMADAITVLSSSWSDANSAGPISSRIATTGTTTINAGILTGNVAATSTYASGGAQNLVRFLENWTDNNGNKGTVTFNGSLGRLFNSKYFTAPYQQPGQVYTVPNRNFSFNSGLQTKTPPGTPTITSFSRGDFFTF